jgi:predicted RecB family endonuclease
VTEILGVKDTVTETDGVTDMLGVEEGLIDIEGVTEGFTKATSFGSATPLVLFTTSKVFKSTPLPLIKLV